MSSEAIGIGASYGFNELEVDTLKKVNEDLAGQDKSGAAAGDRVSISIEGRGLLAKDSEKGEALSESSLPTSKEQSIAKIRERIREIQEQIQEVQESDLPEKQKQRKIQALQSELMILNTELSKLQGRNGLPVAGGTRAEGFASSLT